MKKICIVAEKMLVGGVEKSLLSLLNMIDKDKYEITLYLLKKEGELLNQIPDCIKIKEINLPKDEIEDILYGRKKALIYSLKKYHFFLFVKKMIRLGLISLISRSDEEIRMRYYKSIEKKFSIPQCEYDVAIDYMGYGLLNTMYASKIIKAEKRISWIHFDPLIGMGDFSSFKYYLKDYDYVFCVSQEIRNKMIQLIPDLKDKYVVFYNIVDKNYLLKDAIIGKTYDKYFNGIKILSIGRVDPQKGYDIALFSIKKLVKENYNIHWYIIGEGPQRRELENLIEKNQLKDHITLLGQLTHPYKYLQDCDIYFQPSRHEGYGIALAEARAFCKPIVSSDFAGAREQLIDGITGLIVKCDERELYVSLKRLLDNENLREQLQTNLKSNSNEYHKQMSKLYSIFES